MRVAESAINRLIITGEVPEYTKPCTLIIVHCFISLKACKLRKTMVFIRGTVVFFLPKLFYKTLLRSSIVNKVQHEAAWSQRRAPLVHTTGLKKILNQIFILRPCAKQTVMQLQ